MLIGPGADGRRAYVAELLASQWLPDADKLNVAGRVRELIDADVVRRLV
ncbi:hypothetical protein [Nocardia gipuzkoensis]|nr:hypothetical protein [Nocardia gipuzkoensis]MDE1675328.1 hypothetical protein [Nocardia gipuzkoensis]